MKELRCSTCGAPLTPVAGKSQCRCEYCGSVNVVSVEEKKAESTFSQAAAQAAMAGAMAGTVTQAEASAQEAAMTGPAAQATAMTRTAAQEAAMTGTAAQTAAQAETSAQDAAQAETASKLVSSDEKLQEKAVSGESKVVSLEKKKAWYASKDSAKSGRSTKGRATKTRFSKGNAGFGTSILRMYMVITIVALLLISFALNSASVMADEGNDLRSVPEAAKELEGKSWMDVVEYFRECGFEEVEAREEKDLTWDIFHKDGKVDEISIAGCKNFDDDATFYKDSEVIIYYHSMK